MWEGVKGFSIVTFAVIVSCYKFSDLNKQKCLFYHSRGQKKSKTDPTGLNSRHWQAWLFVDAMMAESVPSLFQLPEVAHPLAHGPFSHHSNLLLRHHISSLPNSDPPASLPKALL